MPGAPVEAPTDDELHRRAEGPFDELIKWKAEDLGIQHWLHDRHRGEDHGDKEDGDCQAQAGEEQLSQLHEFCHLVIPRSPAGENAITTIAASHGVCY
jgi:hypothetical protein